MNEFVHAPGPKRGAHSVCQSHASVDIADKLWCALASVCSLFQQDDLGLLQAKMQVIHVRASGSPASCFQAPLHHSLMVAFKSILTIPIIGIMLAAVGCCRYFSSDQQKIEVAACVSTRTRQTGAFV